MLVFFIIICQVSASAGLCYNLWRYHSQQNRSESLLSWSSCSSGKVTDSIELPLTLTAAAPAKSLQSCPTLCNLIDSSPPGSPIPGILQAREWVAISFSKAWKWKVKVKSLSRVRLLATPWTAAYQAPPSMGFSRQEYWSGLHCLLRWLTLKRGWIAFDTMCYAEANISCIILEKRGFPFKVLLGTIHLYSRIGGMTLRL